MTARDAMPTDRRPTKVLLREAGWTQERVAAALEVSVSTMGRYCHGRSAAPLRFARWVGETFPQDEARAIVASVDQWRRGDQWAALDEGMATRAATHLDDGPAGAAPGFAGAAARVDEDGSVWVCLDGEQLRQLATRA